MSEENQKKIKVEFLPGCFDDFDGTQEELDNLIQEITRQAESGELFKKTYRIDDISDDEIEKSAKPTSRKLN